MTTMFDEAPRSPEPNDADMETQRALDDMAWVLRATRSPVLLATLVGESLHHAASTAEVALGARIAELTKRVNDLLDTNDWSKEPDLTAREVAGDWIKDQEGRNLEQVILAYLAPMGAGNNG